MVHLIVVKKLNMIPQNLVYSNRHQINWLSIMVSYIDWLTSLAKSLMNRWWSIKIDWGCGTEKCVSSTVVPITLCVIVVRGLFSYCATNKNKMVFCLYHSIYSVVCVTDPSTHCSVKTSLCLFFQILLHPVWYFIQSL